MKTINGYSIPIKSYSKCELAHLYFPGSSQSAALRSLNRYIHTARGLLQALMATGYTPNTRRFTRLQVKIIFDHLGEP